MREREACWELLADSWFKVLWHDRDETTVRNEPIENDAKKKRVEIWNVVIRWLFCLPGGVLGAWLSWWFSGVTNGQFIIGPRDSFAFQLPMSTIGSLAMGVAFIFVSTHIAPVKSKGVVFGLAAIGLVSTGVFLFPAIMVAEVWPIVSCVFFAGGIVGGSQVRLARFAYTEGCDKAREEHASRHNEGLPR
jgi:hypothetical protein